MCQTQANAKNWSLNGSIERKIAEHNLSIGSVFAFDLFCKLAFLSLPNVLLLIEAQSIQAEGKHSAHCGRTRTSARKSTTTPNRTNQSKPNNSIQFIYLTVKFSTVDSTESLDTLLPLWINYDENYDYLLTKQLFRLNKCYRLRNNCTLMPVNG